MQELCSRSRGRDCAALAFVLSIFIVIAWATGSSQWTLAGARHSSMSNAKAVIRRVIIAIELPHWISQQEWTRAISVSGRFAGVSDSGDAIMDSQGHPETSSASSDVDMTETLDQATIGGEAAADAPAPGAVVLENVPASAPVDAPAPLTAAAGRETPARDPQAGPPAKTPTAIDAPRLSEVVVQAPGLAPMPASARAAMASGQGPALGPKSPVTDQRWLTGATSDLSACLRDANEEVPVTVEDVLAGELPRRGSGLPVGSPARAFQRYTHVSALALRGRAARRTACKTFACARAMRSRYALILDSST